MTQFELAVLPVGAAEGPVEVDSVGYDGHGEDAVAKSPFGIDIFDQATDCVAASVGGVIPCAVVVDGPIHELKMAVGSDGIDVEEIGQGHLASAKLDAANRHAGGGGEGAGGLACYFVGETDDLVDLVAGEIWGGAKARVANDIEVCESRETERLAQSTPALRTRSRERNPCCSGLSG